MKHNCTRHGMAFDTYSELNFKVLSRLTSVTLYNQMFQTKIKQCKTPTVQITIQWYHFDVQHKYHNINDKLSSQKT